MDTPSKSTVPATGLFDFASLAVSSNPSASTANVVIADASITRGGAQTSRGASSDTLRTGKHVVLISGDLVCGSFIGANGGNKFCTRLGTTCTINKHKDNNKLPKTEEGQFYFKVGKSSSQAFASPALAASKLSETLIDELWEKDLTIETWSKVCSLVNAYDVKFESFAEVENKLDVMDAAKEYRTPAKKRRASTLMDLDDAFDEDFIENSVIDPILNINLDETIALQEDLATETDIGVNFQTVGGHVVNLRGAVKTIMDEAIPALEQRTSLHMEETESAMETLLLRLSQLETMLGSTNDYILSTGGPTVWGTLSDIIRMQEVHSSSSEKTENFMEQNDQAWKGLQQLLVNYKQAIDNVVSGLSVATKEIKLLQANQGSNTSATTSASHVNPNQGGQLSWINGLATVGAGTTTTVGAGTTTTVGAGTTPLSNKSVTVTTSNTSSSLDPAEVVQRFEAVESSLRTLSGEFSAFKQSGLNDQRVVVIGGRVFKSIDDVEAWMKTSMSPTTVGGCMPVGVFTDPMNLLYRIWRQSVYKQSFLKDMELRQKLHLTVDDTIAIEAYDHLVPVLFTNTTKEGSSTLGGDGKTCLTAMKSISDWYNASLQTGVRNTIETQMKTVVPDIKASIGDYLAGHEATISMAESIVDQSALFVTKLAQYITNTYSELTSAGTPSSDAFYLVTKIIRDLFSISFAAERTGIKTGIDPSNPTRTSAKLLWGTFKTMGLVQEFLRYDIKSHPSISTSYVRFVVQHSSLGKVEVMQTKLKAVQEENAKLQEKVKTLQSDMKTVQKTADSAISKIANIDSQLKKLKSSNSGN